MFRLLFISVLLHLCIALHSQTLLLRGKIIGVDNSGVKNTLPNANVYWLGRTSGTLTDSAGNFQLTKPKAESFFLVISYVGFKSDTVLIKKNQTELIHELMQNNTLAEIVIQQAKEGSYISKLNPVQTQVITTHGMQKLACCNLSESFENNASVDVSYSDAVSGARQIQLLGLAGLYGQILIENNPSVHGLAVPFGLGYMPGSWMESIQISKGAAPVISGFESITGTINVEMKKPENAEKLHVNLYGNNHGKAELNLNSAWYLGEKVSTMILAHAERFNNNFDENHDGFNDLPALNQLSLLNRWRFETNRKMVFQFGVKYLIEHRLGGQPDFIDTTATPELYGMSFKTNRVESFFKAGIPLDLQSKKSIAVIVNHSVHKNNGLMGHTIFFADQNSFYGNLIYQHNLKGENNFQTGLSIRTDKINEHFHDTTLVYNYSIPGLFFQYTGHGWNKITVVAGLRGDYNNSGSIYFFTPRLHLKYDISKNTIFKASAGKGYRNSILISENLSLLASSKKWIFSESLQMEEAWNYGASITQYFKIAGRKSTFVIDYFRTDFQHQVVVDVDKHYSEVWFYNLKGISYANSMQAELFIEPIKRLEVNAAVRYSDVKITMNNKLLSKPLVNPLKALLSISYATTFEKWKFDFTVQYNSKSRLPGNSSLPVEYRTSEYSPDFYMMYLQVTKNFKKWNVYVGVENALNVIQKKTIISPEKPYGPYFDASQVWGPLTGRGYYIGLRLNV